MDFVPAEPGEYRSVSILICKQNRCKHMGANGLPPCAGRFCRPQSAIRRSQPPVYHKPSRLPSLCTPTTDTRLPTVTGEAPGHRPPSPARAAVTNTNTVVAGAGRGWGNNKLPPGRWYWNDINHTLPNPGRGASQANVWREPHGGSVGSTPAGRIQYGSAIAAKQNRRTTRHTGGIWTSSASGTVPPAS